MRATYDALGISGIVDVHTHFMPEPVLAKVWAYFDAVGPLLGRPWPITYRADEPTRVRMLRDLGVRTWTSLNYPHKPDMAAWLNEWSATFAAGHPDCLHSATFYPEPGAEAYVRRALDAGARVFKAHVQVGDYDPNDALLDGVWRVLSEAGTPIVIHGGHGPAPGTHTGPAGMVRLARRFPDLVLVVAHMGLPDYAAFLDLVETSRSVHLDTTMAFTAFTEETAPFPASELARLRDLGERVLFGSDYPNIPYPYLHAVESVTGLGLGDDWNRAVLHDNAVRLFGLE
ncbi:amidohydrolase [Nocardioides sp. CBS4Y-1]|uniref:Amidohydrolase n=1 Tax=Nocardioides acrostichi TaxID=2784339 RepID=A0A930UVH7_9ACTN|nr:amidohydrolase [Nocardioides acrostichi]